MARPCCRRDSKFIWPEGLWRRRRHRHGVLSVLPVSVNWRHHDGNSAGLCSLCCHLYRLPHPELWGSLW
eukprot:1087873-Prorocentrum_lima.AAC.1